MTLRLEGVGKRFDDTMAVDDLSLEVHEGEFLTLLGPSGCGKTTTLRMVAGFEKPTAGRIWLNDREMTKLPPQKRGIGMVFQNYALFPHLNVYENVAFGLKASGTPSQDLAGRVAHALQRVDLAGYEKRAVQALSGGQQQRVALARAIAPEPPLLLLDEPLSNLDAALRERTRTELRELLKRLGITAVFVTHDQEEAFALSDRIAVMNLGRLQQLGRPEDLYDDPANVFVAGFMGKANFLPARVVATAGELVECDLPGGIRWKARSHVPDGGSSVSLMVRPESLRITRDAAGDQNAIAGEVVGRRFAGASTVYRVSAEGSPELMIAGPADAAAIGDRVAVAPAPDAIVIAFPTAAAQ